MLWKKTVAQEKSTERKLNEKSGDEHSGTMSMSKKNIATCPFFIVRRLVSVDSSASPAVHSSTTQPSIGSREPNIPMKFPLPATMWLEWQKGEMFVLSFMRCRIKSRCVWNYTACKIT